MSKYHPLYTYLQKQRAEFVPLTFGEIERIVGFKLPKSQAYAAWWSNNPTNNVMTKEWLAAGYRTEQVDLAGRKLVFRRADETKVTGFSEVSVPIKGGPGETSEPRRHPLFGSMKGTFTILPGTDLTAPADPEWADLIDDPNWGKLPE